LHADETSWSESGLALWLWVLCCCHTVLYVIGARTRCGRRLEFVFFQPV